MGYQLVYTEQVVIVKEDCLFRYLFVLFAIQWPFLGLFKVMAQGVTSTSLLFAVAVPLTALLQVILFGFAVGRSPKQIVTLMTNVTHYSLGRKLLAYIGIYLACASLVMVFVTWRAGMVTSLGSTLLWLAGLVIAVISYYLSLRYLYFRQTLSSGVKHSGSGNFIWLSRVCYGIAFIGGVALLEHWHTFALEGLKSQNWSQLAIYGVLTFAVFWVCIWLLAKTLGKSVSDIRRTKISRSERAENTLEGVKKIFLD